MTTDTFPPPVFRLSLLGGFALTGPMGPSTYQAKSSRAYSLTSPWRGQTHSRAKGDSCATVRER